MPLPATSKIIAFVGTTQMAEAKKFYVERLGLRMIAEDGFALVIDVQGTMLRVTAVPKLVPAEYTVLGWEVEDIHAAVQALKESNIAVEHFAGFGQDESGVWAAPDGSALIAWFKDPDGNMLSISQHR